MQGKHLFEYAVIRIVPRVEREEFINAGVILLCKPQKFLKAKYEINKTKISAISREIDYHELEERLKAFDRICIGGEKGGPIGKLDLASRFRWLTSTRSTVVQLSPVHPGLCEDPEKTLDSLYTKLVQTEV